MEGIVPGECWGGVGVGWGVGGGVRVTIMEGTGPIEEGRRVRLQKYCPPGRGRSGRLQYCAYVGWEKGKTTVPMGEGRRGRLLSLLGRGKGQTTEVLSLWEREAGADYCPY